MGTTADKLNKLVENKNAIKQALSNKRGKDVGDNMSAYAQEITNIEPPFDTLNISENGVHNVKDYKNANVLITSDFLTKYIELVENPNKNTVFNVPYGVTKIGDYGLNISTLNINFEGADLISSIGKYGCQRIGEKTLYSNYVNQELILPNCISLGERAFYKRGFAKIELAKITEIPTYCFYFGGINDNGSFNCEINLPICTKIGVGAFAGMVAYNSNNDKKTKLNAPECKEIGNSAFIYCAIYSEYFNVPKLEIIGDSCFSCQGGSGQRGFIGEFIAPENLTTINNRAFYYNTALTKVVLNSKCISIGEYVFYNCKNLKNIELNEGLQTIGQECFNDCTNLLYLKIPSTVTSIGGYFIRNADTVVEFTSQTPPTFTYSPFGSIDKISKIYVPLGTSTAYKNATNLALFADKIFEPNTVIVNVPNELLNSENYQYSLDNGKTYNNFTLNTTQLNYVSIVKLKSTVADTTILVGTSSGASDIGTIANSEITYATSGNVSIYLTIQ